jgi:Membrane carboxypeptidase/penicillin-binding protein
MLKVWKPQLRDILASTRHELSLAQSAMLIGLLPAPSRYGPNNNPEPALIQRDRVEKRMLNEHFITVEEYVNAKEEEIKLIEID